MQQIARSVALAFNNLPRPHRVMLGSLTVLTLAVAVWRPYVYHRDATPIVKTIELEQNEIRSLLPEASEPIDQAAQEDEAIPQDELDDKIAGEAGVHEYVVSTGDTLSSILNQYGIDMGDITQLAAADKELRNLKIGQQLSWTLTADGELQRLTWEVSRRETRTYDRTMMLHPFDAAVSAVMLCGILLIAEGALNLGCILYAAMELRTLDRMASAAANAALGAIGDALDEAEAAERDVGSDSPVVYDAESKDVSEDGE